MNAQGMPTPRSGWAILADFAQTLAVGVVAGVLFSLLSALVVFVVSSID